MVLGPTDKTTSFVRVCPQAKVLLKSIVLYIKPFLYKSGDSMVKASVCVPVYSIPSVMVVNIVPPSVLTSHWYVSVSAEESPMAPSLPKNIRWNTGPTEIVGSVPVS
jgi:hypothetical protein